MSKQFAVIGLAAFGTRVLSELLATDAEVLIIDKNQDAIDQYKDQVAAAYRADVLREEIIRKIVPEDLDGAVIDLGDAIEASILVTYYLKKLKTKRIVVKAETEQHGEILDIVGATQVVYPDREAAIRVVPSLLSDSLFNYLRIAEDLAIAEVRVPRGLVGRTVVEAGIRRLHNVTVIAAQGESEPDYHFIRPDHRFADEEKLLVVGAEANLAGFAQTETPAVAGRREGLGRLFGRLLRGRRPES